MLSLQVYGRPMELSDIHSRLWCRLFFPAFSHGEQGLPL